MPSAKRSTAKRAASKKRARADLKLPASIAKKVQGGARRSSPPTVTV